MTTPEPLLPEPVADAAPVAEPAAAPAAAETAPAADATTATTATTTESAAGAAVAASAAVAGRGRRVRWMVLGGLVVSLVIVASTATWYTVTRKPLPIPTIVDSTAVLPHYMYSIYGVDKPIGVAVTDDGGRIYVTEAAGEKALRVLDGSGNTISQSGPDGTTSASRVPVYDARDPLTGEVYVSDRLRGSIDIFDADGVYQRTLTAPPEVTVWEPLGLAFDTEGTLYISDVSGDAHRVLVIDRAGALVRTISNDGDPMQYPNGIAPTADAVYVTDSNNGQLVRSDDVRTAVVVGRGVADGDLGLPRGIATDDQGRMYVVDVSAHAISVYDLPKDGAYRPTFVGTFGEQGRLDGQFMFPNAVAADARGHLFISDQENNRIQVWGY